MAQALISSSAANSLFSHAAQRKHGFSKLLAGIFFLQILFIAALVGNEAYAAPPPQNSLPKIPVAQSTPMHDRIAELEQNLLHSPGDAAQWTELGNLYFDTGATAKAIEAYNQSLKLKPDNADVLTDLGIMYRECAHYKEAVNCFLKAIQVNPSHQNALFNLGVVLYFDLQETEESRIVFDRLLRLNPQATTPHGEPLSALFVTLFE